MVVEVAARVVLLFTVEVEETLALTAVVVVEECVGVASLAVDDVPDFVDEIAVVSFEVEVEYPDVDVKKLLAVTVDVVVGG